MWPFSKKDKKSPSAASNQEIFVNPAPQQNQKPEKQKGDEWFEEEEEVFEGQLALDVYQTDMDVVIKAPVAGVYPQDIDISITDDILTIQGERRRDETIPDEAYFCQECYYGPFSRSIILPVPVVTEKADASFRDGILTIIVPKAEQAKTKVLKIKTE